MAEPVVPDPLPTAMAVRPKRGRISIIWIIPILAALVAVGIGIQRLRNEGTTITIVFSEGDGIEANKTLIKYKDVTIGRVTAVQLTDDYAKVSVTAKIAKHAEGLLVDDAKFWVVRPNISLSGISGLSTLLSGNYIEFQSGKSTDSRDSFIGLDVAPVITRQQGREFILNASDLGSLDIGSPIYYRRLQVGQVIAYDLTPDGKAIRLKVFVNAPYDKFVFPGTRFWNASGLDVAIGADGVAVRTESLVALLAGGLAFDTPPFAPVADPAPANAAFTLYPTRSAALKTPDGVGRTYVLYFNESMRGLSVGAPVTFLGLPAGEVTSVGLAIDAAKADIRPRVTISFYPDRLIALATAETGTASIASVLNDEPKRRAFLKRIFEERGLRAQLRSGSLITGQMYVAFDYYPGAAKTKLDLNQAVPELPVVPGTLAALEAKLTSILDKVDKMPFEALGNDLKKDLEDLDGTLTGATKLMSDADVQLMPQLKVDIEDLHRTLAGVERAINNADATLLSPNAPGQQDLRNALQEFARAARSLRALADQIERQPSSLIRGKTDPSSGGK
jgi:paraquat-inducible protein B